MIARVSIDAITRSRVHEHEHDRWRSGDRLQVIIAIIQRRARPRLSRICSELILAIRQGTKRAAFQLTRENSRDRAKLILNAGRSGSIMIDYSGRSAEGRKIYNIFRCSVRTMQHRCTEFWLISICSCNVNLVKLYIARNFSLQLRYNSWNRINF